jgi:dihydroxy-acid dehydratase
VRIDLEAGTADMLLSDAEIAARRAELARQGGPRVPDSQTPWQEIYRSLTDQLADGMVLRPAVNYRRVAEAAPRDNH